MTDPTPQVEIADPDEIVTLVPPRSTSYQIFILVLSTVALGIVAALTFVRLPPETVRVLHWADFVVCVFFFIDFAYSLATAPNRTLYFFSWGWIDLVSSIPLVVGLRFGRAVRIVRILQVLRAARASKMVASFLIERRASSGGLAAVLIAFLVLFSGTVAILQFELHHGGPIDSAGNALYWAITTITTVGYGDLYPVTTGGKVVASAMMVGGVMLYGVVAGLVASWFLRPIERELDSDTHELHEELRELRTLIESRLTESDASGSPPRKVEEAPS